MKTRILYVLPAGERGGAEVSFLTILENLNRNLFEPFVIALKDGPFVSELQQQGLAPTVLKTSRFRSIKDFAETAKSIRDFIQSNEIDIVHCNGTGAQIYAGFASGLAGVPCIYHLHDSVEWSWNRQGIVHLLAQLSLPLSRILSRRNKRLEHVAVSKYVADQFQQTWGSRKNIQVIYNSVRCGNGANKLKQIEPNHVPRIVWIGRLQRWKGTHIFLRAASIVKEKFPGAQFSVVGGSLFGIENGYEKELQDMTRSLNLGNCLKFAGHQSSIEYFLQSADIVVHSSITPEPFGLVLLEAMKEGKPVVASNEGGPIEIVENGITGLLVPPNDSQELANAIIMLLNDATLRTKMGKAAQERVKKYFNPSKMMHAIENLYSELASENSKRVQE